MSTLHNFEGNKSIILQPGDSKKPFEFEVTICSSAISNDGWIPYGTTISGIAVTAYKDDKTDVTSTMIDSTPTELDNVVTVLLNHIDVNGEYYLYFLLSLDVANTTVGTYFRNIKVRGN